MCISIRTNIFLIVIIIHYYLEYVIIIYYIYILYIKCTHDVCSLKWT